MVLLGWGCGVMKPSLVFIAHGGPSSTKGAIFARVSKDQTELFSAVF